MKLAPHVVLQTMKDMGASHPSWREPKSLPMIYALIKQSVLFDFGAVHPAQEHKDFALDLYERGLFSLPFPVTAFGFSGVPNPSPAFGNNQAAAGGMIIVSQDEDKSLSAVMCTEQRDQHGKSMGGIPFAIMLKAKLSNQKEGSINVEEQTYPIVSDRVLRLMYGDNAQIVHDTMVQRIASNLVAAMGMTVMLMSKGVETERTPAPDRLNRARKLRGKPSINDMYSVRIKAGDAYSVATAGGEENIAGHTRGSPRMHWRRGHLRCLFRGTEQERIVPIPPSIIGANDAAEPLRKAYKIRS